MRWKSIFAVALCGPPIMASASTCSTVAAGSVENPATWNCFCQPSTCDTIYILHDCYTSGSLTFANALVEIGATGMLTSSDTLTFTGRFTNHGTVNVHRLVKPSFSPKWKNTGSVESSVLWLWGDSALNTGTVNAVDTLNIGTYTRFESHGYVHGDFLWSGGVENYDTVMFNRCQSDLLLANVGFFQVAGLFINLMVVSNETSGVLRADTLLSYGRVDNLNLMQIDHLLQFGTQQAPQGELEVFPASSRIDCGNLKNHGTINGAGDICVQDSTINYATGSILGTPDICDATLSTTSAPFMDINLGLVGNAVHWCPNTNCFNGVPSLHDRPWAFHAYPVPAHSTCTIETPWVADVAGVDAVTLQGKALPLSFRRAGDLLILDVTALPTGLYLCMLRAIDGRDLGAGKLLVATR